MMSQEEKIWLVRYSDHSFSRPLSEKELFEKIKAGELKTQDEVCGSEGYWFSLQDVKEVRKHFGEVSLEGLFRKPIDEVTLENEPVTATTIQVPTFAHHATAPNVTVPTTSLTTKILMAILILAVGILVFVYFD